MNTAVINITDTMLNKSIIDANKSVCALAKDFSFDYNEAECGQRQPLPAAYADGTEATVDQMAKDVTTFLSWAAEPELEERHRTGVKVIIYLILLTTLVYLSMKKIWSRVDSEV